MPGDSYLLAAAVVSTAPVAAAEVVAVALDDPSYCVPAAPLSWHSFVACPHRLVVAAAS